MQEGQQIRGIRARTQRLAGFEPSTVCIVTVARREVRHEKAPDYWGFLESSWKDPQTNSAGLVLLA